MAKKFKQVIGDKIWEERIKAGEEYRKKWESTFKCDILEKYYEGQQWADPNEDDPPYTINKVYETIQIKLDSFMSETFSYNVNPRAISSDFDLEQAALSSQLKEGVLNTLVTDHFLDFSGAVKAAYKDHFFRFGVLEVGYEADWLTNPNAQKAATNYDNEEQPSGPVKKANEPDELPFNERVYFKHIPAKTFYVGGLDHRYLHRCTWYGYYEYVHKNDLLASKKLMNKDEVEAYIGSGEASVETFDTNGKHEQTFGEAVKIWHLWDTKNKVRVVVLDGNFCTLYQKFFTRQTVFDYRPDSRVTTESFYPIPPVFHWLSPQRELNEIREQMKVHRKRFVRKFQSNGDLDEEEIEKFENGPDGTIIKTKGTQTIIPIQNADLGIIDSQMLNISTDDMNKISGVSVIARGETSNRTTATESTLIDAKASLRDNAERSRISSWLSKVGREILLTVRDKFTFGMWVNLTADSKESFLGEVQANQQAYVHVSSEDLSDNYDFRIDVDPIMFSSVSREEEKQKFFEFLAVTSQFPQIAMSPKLIRETAYRIGYRNEAVIREMQKMALLAQLGAQAGVPGLANGAQGSGNMGQNMVQRGTPPAMEQIRQQLTSQVGK